MIMNIENLTSELRKNTFVEYVQKQIDSIIAEKNPKVLLDSFVTLSELERIIENAEMYELSDQIIDLNQKFTYPNYLLNEISKLQVFIIPEVGEEYLKFDQCLIEYNNCKSHFNSFEEYLSYNVLYVFFSANSSHVPLPEPSLDGITYGYNSTEFFMWMHKFLDVDSSYVDHFYGVELEAPEILLDTTLDNMIRWSGVKISDQYGVTLEEFRKDGSEDFSFYKYCEYLADSYA